jgi:hypothetical protein
MIYDNFRKKFLESGVIPKMDKVYYHEYKEPYEKFILFIKDPSNVDVPVLSFNSAEIKECGKSAVRIYNNKNWIKGIFVGPKSIKLSIFLFPDEIEITINDNHADVSVNQYYKSINSEYLSRDRAINKAAQMLTDLYKKIDVIENDLIPIVSLYKDVLSNIDPEKIKQLFIVQDKSEISFEKTDVNKISALK